MASKSQKDTTKKHKTEQSVFPSVARDSESRARILEKHGIRPEFPSLHLEVPIPSPDPKAGPGLSIIWFQGTDFQRWRGAAPALAR